MARYRASTGLREIINEKKGVFLGIAIVMVAFAGGYLAYTQHVTPRPKGDKAFYTVDDGKTWFIDSLYRAPPFKHDGKIAVRAMVYSFDNGRQRFCPIVERFSGDTKKNLDGAIAKAARNGEPLSSIPLFNSIGLEDGAEIKPSQSDQDWVPRTDRDESTKILHSIKAPDGSAVDFVIP